MAAIAVPVATPAKKVRAKKPAAAVTPLPEAPPQAEAKPVHKGRAPAALLGRRSQFRFAVEALHASSIVDGKWLTGPDEQGNGTMLGMFYYRAPEPKRFQVYKVARAGQTFASELIGAHADRKVAYQRFYSSKAKKAAKK